MAEILLVTWDGGGNVPPALGIAAELVRRGHSVRVLGHAQQREVVEAAGHRFVAYRHARRWSALDRNGAWAFFAMFTDPGPGQDVREALPGADLVLVDCMSLGALKAALDSGLPVVVLVHTFYRYLAQNWARGPIGLLARLRGLAPQPMWDRADAVLVAADAELDPAESLPPNVEHIGPVQPAAGPRAAATGTHVLVSLSTITYPGQPAALQRIVDALGTLRLPATVTTGPSIDPDSIRAGSDVVVVRRADHDDVLQQASLVVGHGGHGTTMRALGHGVPLLVLPMHPMLDQPMIGKAVTEAGAGLTLKAKASSEAIATAVRSLLDDPAYRTAAASIAARLAKQDGAGSASDRIEALLKPSTG